MSPRTVTLERSVTLARPAAEVWAWVADYANDPRWREGVDRMEQRPAGGPAAEGTTTEEHLRALGRRLVVHARVVACAPGRRLDFASTVAPLRSRGFREVVATPDGGARLTYGLTVELTGLYALLAGPLARSYGRRIEADLARLRALLEGGGAGLRRAG